MDASIVLESTLTCPACGAQTTETMPAESCQFFYLCSQCQTTHRPNPGDCCVFCSFGSMPCPPIQIERQGDDRLVTTCT